MIRPTIDPSNASAPLPTAAATDDIMKLCAGGGAVGIEGEVKGELTRFLKGAEAAGQAKITDFGAVLDKMKPDAVGVEFYRIYTQCLKEQAEITLKKYNVKITDQLSQIEMRVKAQPFNFPKGVFQTVPSARRPPIINLAA
ncbi:MULTISPECIES: hypothetical protein [unclassified Bradyrhizobium]|uniref:hypothetical protein n=1 Tax=unclassified Bradyrhizobium TaxID=2631580 RepID=UPI003393C0FE